MSFHYSKQLRQEKKKKEALTEEQVYAHYHPNVEKGQMAIHFAVQQGRRDLRVAISQFCTNHDRYILVELVMSTLRFQGRSELPPGVGPQALQYLYRDV